MQRHVRTHLIATICLSLLTTLALASDGSSQIPLNDPVAELVYGEFEDTQAVRKALMDSDQLMSKQQIEDVVNTYLRRPIERGQPNYADAAYQFAHHAFGGARAAKYRKIPEIRRNLVQCCLPNFIAQAINADPSVSLSVEQALKVLDDLESEVLPAGEEPDFSAPLLNQNALAALHAIVWLDDQESLREFTTHRSAAVGLAALYALTRLGSEDLLDLALYHASRADDLSDFNRNIGCFGRAEGFSVASLAWLIVADFLSDAEQNIYFAAVADRDAANEILDRGAQWEEAAPALIDQYRLRAGPENVLDLAVVAGMRDESDLPLLLRSVESSSEEDAWLTFSQYDHPEVLAAMWRWWEQTGRHEPPDSMQLAAFVITAQTMSSLQGVDQYRSIIRELLARKVPELNYIVFAGHADYWPRHQPSTEASRALLQLTDFLLVVHPMGRSDKADLMIELVDRAQRWTIDDLEARLRYLDEDVEREWFCQELINLATYLNYSVGQADLPACWDLELELDAP